MQIRLGEGSKAQNDVVIEVYAPFWQRITIRELLTLIKLIMENEDRLYSHGKGRFMLLEAIIELAKGASVDEVTKKYAKKKVKHYV